jgi:two-component system, LytTR family, sensor kinase
MTQKIFDYYLKLYPIEGASPKRRIAVHLLFWTILLIFQFLVAYTDTSNEVLAMELISFILKAIIIYYGLTYFALPKLFSKNQFAIGIVLVILVYCLNYLHYYGFYAFGINHNYFAVNTNWYKYAQKYVAMGYQGLWKPVNIFFEIEKLITDIGIAFIVKFSRTISKYSVKADALKNENSKIEMAFLRNQLNPHFLLNSLNNIYSQVISQDPGAKHSIAVLSDLMKYIFYNSGETLVDLESEVQFLNDYIDLEKLRGNKYLNIQYTKEGEMVGYKIAPLILINYVENAFKYASSQDGAIANISIHIKFSNEVLIVKIENDFIDKTVVKSKESGVGIENARKRLALLYPENHGLTNTKESNKFLVEVWLRLQRE